MVREKRPRLVGLDFARGLALIGMVIVNFEIVMCAHGEGAASPGVLLQGRSAALFVVLAGIGFTLGGRSKAYKGKVGSTVRRSVVLLVIGLLNMLVFPADIIHYYAVYFLIGLIFLRMRDTTLLVAAAACVVTALALLIGLDFDKGWNWSDYSYADFWTPEGFARNLFYNGWHPVFPWAAFLLFGMWLGRQDLHCRGVLKTFMLWGSAIYVATMALSLGLQRAFADTPDLIILFGNGPVPAVPLYMLAGASAATAVTGICLHFTSFTGGKIAAPVRAMGRQSLTLYMAHILVGMSAIEALGLLGGQTVTMALVASVVFCSLAGVYAYVWSRHVGPGPLEALLRRV